jgi:putative membrane protein
MNAKSIVGLVAGLALIVALVAWNGIEAVAAMLAEAGFAALLVCLFEPFDQWLGAEAWRRLFPAGRRPRAWHALWATCMGSAVNTLLPVATIGGEVAKARVLTHWGHSGIDAVSTMVVDKTVQAVAVLLWGLVGTAILAFVVDDPRVVLGALAGAALLSLGIAGFVGVQLSGGVSRFARGAARVVRTGKWAGLVRHAGDLDFAIRELYRRPGAIALSLLIRLLQRVWLVGELVLAAWLIGQPIGFGEAAMLKGLIGAVRGLSFAVPSGLGVQEGGYVAVGALIGLPAELMIAVSLVTRLREIVPAIPFLLLWQHVEGRALWRRRRLDAAAKPRA